MKQASFKICEIDKLKTKIETNNETNNKTKSIETNVDSKKTITSNKPIKRVENIYYFR